MNKRILTIQDFSSVGRCSLTVAIPIISALGHEVIGLPTALLSTQTSGITGFTFNDLYSNMLPSYDHWKSLGIKFDCLYTGFLGTLDCVDTTIKIAKDLKNSGTIIAIDPAMAEDGKLYKIFDKKYYERMVELCKLSDIFMPNFTEGKMLAGLSMELEPNKENANMILNILNSNGFKTVILSGIEDDELCGVATLNDGMITFQMNKRFPEYIHGAGDVLSSVFIGEISRGKGIEQAAQIAVDFVYECINISVEENFDPRFGLNFERIIPKLFTSK
ncbi:MAG: bifunctional hydroxymethylpyrimidine kinase/phosphomethylpyrimidine kinase [Clostridia bacterium]|nr:bifunctional hydroxymethylpyrimidine kinase/phosphomethylpyrimidine kinase [Clostridia bacterium]